MTAQNGLEAIILSDARVVSEIDNLGHTLKGRKNPLAMARNFLLGRMRYTREELVQLAKNYFARMRSEAYPESDSMKITGAIADFTVAQLFTEPHAEGIEKLTAAISEGKRVKLYSTHFSYYDIAIEPHEFKKRGIKNVYYVGGVNVTSMPIIGWIIGPLFRNSGQIQVDRGLKGKKAKLQDAVMQAYVSYLLNNRAIVVDFSGRGRNHHEVEPVNASSSAAAITDSDVAFAVAVAYDDPPEGKDFALETGSKMGKSVVKYMLHPVTKFFDKGHYGEVYVSVSEPIATADYKARYLACSKDGPRKSVIREFEHAVTTAMIRAVTVTPTSLLAAAVERCSSKRFTLEQIAATVEGAVADLSRTGANVAGSLKSETRESLERAAYRLAERGALSFDGKMWRVREPKIVRYFAEKAMPTLGAFGVSLKYEGRAVSEQPALRSSPQASAPL